MTACPTASQIDRYAAGELSRSQIDAIDRHAEACLPCAEKLASAPPFDEVLADVRQASQGDTHTAAEVVHIQSLAANEDPLVGRVIGDFEVRAPIGSGGMGAVYQAEQISLKRRVALKVLHAPMGAQTSGVLRFGREARAAARLHHTNIVSVFAQGQSEGLRYYAMEMIDGSGLDQVIREIRRQRAEDQAGDADESASRRAPKPAWDRSGRLGRSEFDMHRHLVELDRTDPRKRFDASARLIADIADALDYAHRQGVIHRDVKPSNLILSADGRLSLTDFGLARMLEQPGMTIAGEFLGSPLYMSPEQVAAGRVPIDHRTDIYSLGATLYELLCLQPPYPGETREQIVAQIREGKFRPPSQIDGRIPRDLETVCLKAMRADSVHRYESAGEMADDLRRFVDRFAIQARRISLMNRAVKFVRRRAYEVAMLAGLLGVVVGASLVSLHFWNLNYWAEEELAFTEGQKRKMWYERDTVRLEQALDKGYLAAAGCRFAEARQAFTEAIDLVERDRLGHLAADAAGYVGRGLTGYVTELIGIDPGRSGFAGDFRAALALRPGSDLLDVLCKLPDPAKAGQAPTRALAPLLARMAETDERLIERLTHGHNALIYAVWAWLALAGKDLDRASAWSDQALAEQPNLSVGYLIHAMVLLAKVQPDRAVEDVRWAVRLASPRGSRGQANVAADYFPRAMASFVLGQRDEVARRSRRALRALSSRPIGPRANTAPAGRTPSTRPLSRSR